VLVLWAARRLGRAVEVDVEPARGLVTDERAATTSSAELALDPDGKFLRARRDRAELGAYLTPRSAGPGTNNVGGVAGVYTTPAIHVQTTGRVHQHDVTGPYIGAPPSGSTTRFER